MDDGSRWFVVIPLPRATGEIVGALTLQTASEEALPDEQGLFAGLGLGVEHRLIDLVERSGRAGTTGD